MTATRYLIHPGLLRYPTHRWVTVPGANHCDVLVGEAGAAAVAAAIITVVGQTT